MASNSWHRPRTISAGKRYIRPMNVRYSCAVRLSNSARSSGTTPTRRLTSRAALAAERSCRGFALRRWQREQAREHLDGS